MIASILILAVFFIIVSSAAVYPTIRSRKVLKHLHAGDVDRFIAETDRAIYGAMHEKILRMQLINKTAGLFYKGAFDESLIILDSFKPDKLNKVFKAVYVNNLLANLLLDGQISRAQSAYAEYREVIENKSRNKALGDALKSTLASYEYYSGNLDRAEAMFTEVLAGPRPEIAKAFSHYFLGLIARDRGDLTKATEMFDIAERLGKNTFVPEKIKELRSSLNATA